LSGISFYKFCFLKRHRSISASLAFLKIILLVATIFANFQILLQTTGVVFPKRPVDAPPIFTPPATHNSSSPRYATGSLSDRMSSDVETLRLCPFPWRIGLISHFLAQLICLVILTVIFFYSLGDLNNIRNVTDLLNDMVHALNPSDRTV